MVGTVSLLLDFLFQFAVCSFIVSLLDCVNTFGSRVLPDFPNSGSGRVLLRRVDTF